MITVREAGVSDMQFIEITVPLFLLELYEKFGEPVPSDKNINDHLGVISSWIENKNGVVLVAEDEGATVGALASGGFGESLFDTPYKFVAYGLFAYVLPEERKSGVAKMLHEELYNRLKELGHDAVLCSVHFNNKDSMSSMLRLGFVPSQIIMAKSLGD